MTSIVTTLQVSGPVGEVTLVVDASRQSVIPGKIFSFLNYFNYRPLRVSK